MGWTEAKKRKTSRRVPVPANASVAGRVPVHVKTTLEWVATRDGRTISQVVREACERYVEQEVGSR